MDSVEQGWRKAEKLMDEQRNDELRVAFYAGARWVVNEQDKTMIAVMRHEMAGTEVMVWLRKCREELGLPPLEQRERLS